MRQGIRLITSIYKNIKAYIRTEKVEEYFAILLFSLRCPLPMGIRELENYDLGNTKVGRGDA